MKIASLGTVTRLLSFGPHLLQAWYKATCDVEQTQPLDIPQSLPKPPGSLFEQCLMPLQMWSAPIWWCESEFLDTCHRARLEVDSGKAAVC